MSKIVFLLFLLASLNYFSQKKINDTINCNYRENKSSVFPKCKSDKKVLPIFYGLTTGKFMKKKQKKIILEVVNLWAVTQNGTVKQIN
ncbi:hypothetical protein [Epilithonimonas vandammei]|uniref:hypothetical protein n=1 Tax=Epilithonimonas vandammei TaxID=2487072 RepID=UPI00289BCE70|nr:hypothetical protein [Epilithonimonas vandammei]